MWGNLFQCACWQGVKHAQPLLPLVVPGQRSKTHRLHSQVKELLRIGPKKYTHTFMVL